MTQLFLTRSSLLIVPCGEFVVLRMSSNLLFLAGTAEPSADISCLSFSPSAVGHGGCCSSIRLAMTTPCCIIL